MGRTLGAWVVWLVVGVCGPWPAASQTDYYNTDSARPVLIEDAYPVERYAFEGQVAPLRMERSDRGTYHWEFEPELAYGILPRTQAELGLHLDFTDEADAGRRLGLQAIELSALHNFNVETISWPALAVSGELVLPLEESTDTWVYPTIKGILTRTYSIARVHGNVQYTYGSRGAVDESAEISRWLAGIALDRAMPLHGALLVADVYVEDPLRQEADLEWTIEAGARYQLDPFFALDIGAGRRFAEEDAGWFVTVGAARTFAVRSLIPIPRR